MLLALNIFVVDKQNGTMMGIFNDKVETISAEAQMKPFKPNSTEPYDCYNQKQCGQGFNESL